MRQDNMVRKEGIDDYVERQMRLLRQRIKDVMQWRGMTARELAVRIDGKNTRREYLKDMERKPDIRVSSLMKICWGLGVSPAELLTLPVGDTPAGRGALIYGEKEVFLKVCGKLVEQLLE